MPLGERGWVFFQKKVRGKECLGDEHTPPSCAGDRPTPGAPTCIESWSARMTVGAGDGLCPGVVDRTG